MKKVGIISMQRIINYGSFLQAYGLKNIIEKNTDNHVEFIDYEFEKELVKKEQNKKNVFCKIKENKTLLRYLKKKKYLKEVAERYTKDLKIIGVGKNNFYPKVDAVVIGSDEVFNCTQSYPIGYSRNLFGKGYEKIDVLSYAASFGYTTYDLLKKYKIDREVGQMLEKFKAISVRDNNSLEVVNKLVGIEPEKNLDPVLVYNFKNEIKKYKTHEQNYIILYAYTGRLSAKEEAYIKKFAKKNNKKIISIGYFSAIAEKNIICNPLYVFSYFKNADYVITDTFHGSIFSIKMNTKFCTIIRESNKNKLTDLLKTLGRTDRMVEKLEDIERLYNIEIDYKNTNQVIKKEQEKAINYIKKYLK